MVQAVALVHCIVGKFWAAEIRHRPKLASADIIRHPMLLLKESQWGSGAQAGGCRRLTWALDHPAVDDVLLGQQHMRQLVCLEHLRQPVLGQVPVDQLCDLRNDGHWRSNGWLWGTKVSVLKTLPAHAACR